MFDQINLNDEYIDEYLLTTKDKQKMMILLDLLKVFQSVCEKYGLTYYAYGGTLLGAVRHKGFIPWDDDIDILMPRKDYNALLTMHDRVFHEPYFMQTPLNGRDYARFQMKLYNTNTSMVNTYLLKSDICQGMNISIFPLDEVPYGSLQKKLFFAKIYIYKQMAMYYNTNRYFRNIYQLKSLKAKAFNIFCRLYFAIHDTSYLFNAMHKHCAKYEGMGEQVASTASVNYKPKNVTWEKRDFADKVYMQFENIEICVPGGWDNVLRQQYGNYQKMPSVEKRGTHRHDNHCISHCDVPYKKTVAKMRVDRPL